MLEKTKMQKQLSAKKNTEKYKRLARKRKLKSAPTTVTIDGFQNPSKKRKSTTKSAIITARNIAKKYKKLRYRLNMDEKKQFKKAKKHV